MNTQETVSKLEKLYKRYHFSLIAVIVLLIAALGCTFVSRPASVIVGVIALAIFLAVTTPAKKKYKEETTVSNILLTVGRKISAKSVEPKHVTVLTEEIIENANLQKSTAKAEGGKTEFIFADKAGGRPGTAALAKLEELAAYTPGVTALSLRGKSLDVFIMNRFLSTEVNPRMQPNVKLLEFNPYTELNRILELATSRM